MATSLTALSKKYLQKQGYVVERVEHFNYFARRRVDLLGVGDLLAMNGEELLLVQVTSRNNLSARKAKARASDKLPLWLNAGGKFVLHGWDKPKFRWRLKEEEYDNKKQSSTSNGKTET